MHKLYIHQDRRLIALVINQQQTRFGYRENVVSVITRNLNDLTLNISYKGVTKSSETGHID